MSGDVIRMFSSWSLFIGCYLFSRFHVRVYGFVPVCLPVAERRLGPAGVETGRHQTGGQVHPGEEVGEEGEAEE